MIMNLRHIVLWQIELLPWYALILVWAVTAFRVKRSKATEKAYSRFAYDVPVIAGFYLLFSRSLPLLNFHLVAPTYASELTGSTITWLGALLAIWARFIIGKNWSANVSRKVGHELVRGGPYAYIRHPIYAGLTLAMIGTAVFIGELRGVVGVLFALSGQIWKATREEEFLLAEFGASYQQYRRETGFLIPGGWATSAIEQKN